MNKTLAIKKLNKYKLIEEKDILFFEKQISDISFFKLREINYSLGNLLEEDDDNHLFVTSVKSGFFKQNQAYVVTQLTDDVFSVAIYSKEGIIKQNTSKKILNSYLNELKANETKKAKNYRRYMILIPILILCILGSFLTYQCVKGVSLTKEYNTAVEDYNNSATSYNGITKDADVSNIEGYPTSLELLSTQSVELKDVLNSILKGNSTKIIKNDIDKLKNMKSELDNMTTIVSTLVNPTEEWVISKLSACDNISNINAVTSDNDPLGFLGKENGYSSAIYFTVNQLNNQENQDSIQLGAEGGGCVEVYSSVDDALSRCDYLSSFDNTILSSGSHVIIGTMVVRTSYQLDESSQYNLTNEIFKSFTNSNI